MRPKDNTPIMLSLILERCTPNCESVSVQCYALCAAVQAGTEVAEDSVTITVASNIGSSPYIAQKRATWNPDLWRSWMDDCCKTHTLCNAIKQHEHAPTRLIDVGSETIAPRLIESRRGLQEYVALSHCWGDDLPLRTTSANYHEHTTAISWEAMPTTFRDAIEVTRALGCQYLWIDCLCIIQDSEEDWSRECTLMREVYAGAIVTISSSQGKSATDGIFKPMLWSDLACDISITWPSTKEADVLYIDFPAHPRQWSPTSIMSGRLSTRAWALQERVLSRRMLHICERGTFFECACSEVTDRLPWPMALSWLDTNLLFYRNFMRLSDPHQVLLQWHGLISNYASRSLTYAGDRLPAVAGIARAIAERHNWGYVAGLWTHDLVAGLLWEVTDPDIPLNKQSSSYTGPSWSWASINRTMLYIPDTIGTRHDRSWFVDRSSITKLKLSEWAPCLHIPAWNVELVGEDSYAEVKSGQLTIVGKMRPINLKDPAKPCERRQDLTFSPGQSVEVTYFPDAKSPLPSSNPCTETWCLLAGFHRQTMASTFCDALIVQPVLERPATFKRIGFIWFGCHVRDETVDNAWAAAVDWLLAAEDQQIYLI